MRVRSILYGLKEVSIDTIFGTSQMTHRGSRKLHKKTVRQMLTLSHFRFKAFLKHKAKEAGVIVIDVSEAYTSKTILWTSEIIRTLGGKKIIKDNFGMTMDRDLEWRTWNLSTCFGR